MINVSAPKVNALNNVNNAKNAVADFAGDKVQSKPDNIFGAKPSKDEFVPSKKEDNKKAGFLDKVKNLFTFQDKKQPAVK